MFDWIGKLRVLLEHEPAAVRVAIVAVTGPTPREVGTTMLVSGTGTAGRLGGGPLEQAAVAAARRLLLSAPSRIAEGGPVSHWRREFVELETGLVLGKASGGAITLLLELFGRHEAAQLPSPGALSGAMLLVRRLGSGSPIMLVAVDRGTGSLPRPVAAAAAAMRKDRQLALVIEAADEVGQPAWLIERTAPAHVPFYVYGAGRVGRALVRVLAELPFDVHWVDRDPARLCLERPVDAAVHPAADPPAVAAAAPAGSFHAVMSTDHDLDYAICRRLLEINAFGFAGVIGSRLKRERLAARLAADGIPPSVVSHLMCPIGMPGINSKAPAVIAVAIAAQALLALEGGCRHSDV